MKTRLVILLVVAIGMALALVFRPKTPEGQEQQFQQEMTPEELALTELMKTPLSQRDLPGEEPPEPAEVRVSVQVDPQETKNRLYLLFSEAHGYYVESLKVDIYRVVTDEETGEEELQYFMSNPFDCYIQAREVLRQCILLVPSEMERIGNDLGTSEDWVAEVVSYGRARVENPDPLPPLPDESWCR
jgi:hypothetical protein